MNRMLAGLLIAMIALSGCASSTQPPRPPGGPLIDARRLAVVPSGESRFTEAGQATTADDAEQFRTVDEILKWVPYGPIIRPIAKLVQWGLTRLNEAERKVAAASRLGSASPQSVVVDAFARSLQASKRFEEVLIMEQEPSGDDRRRADAIVRLTVPSWGVMRVSQGPDLMACFADVRGQMVLRGTGVVVWQHDEDVTHTERLPLDSFTRNREFARQELVEVLERAGERLASELLYARSAGR